MGKSGAVSLHNEFRAECGFRFSLADKSASRGGFGFAQGVHCSEREVDVGADFPAGGNCDFFQSLDDSEGDRTDAGFEGD